MSGPSARAAIARDAGRCGQGVARVGDFEFRVPADLEQAFDEFVRAKAEALLVPPDTTFSTNRARIAELAAKARLPAIYGDRRAVESGGLLSYGPNVVETIAARQRMWTRF